MKKYKISKEDLLLEQQEEELQEGNNYEYDTRKESGEYDYEYDTRKESGEYDYLWEELDSINYS